MSPAPTVTIISTQPYHLVTNELPLSVAAAVLERHATVYARHGLVTEVTGVAKRDLKAREMIDALGGAILYGSNDLHGRAREMRQVPMCLLPGARLLRDVPKDAVITYDMVALDTGTSLYHLRALQDGSRAGVAADAPRVAAPARRRAEAAV